MLSVSSPKKPPRIAIHNADSFPSILFVFFLFFSFILFFLLIRKIVNMVWQNSKGHLFLGFIPLDVSFLPKRFM